MEEPLQVTNMAFFRRLLPRRRQQAPQQPQPRRDPFEEIGSIGIEAYSGFVNMAYTADLKWPTVEPEYSRIWRSDPATTIVRTIYNAWAGQQQYDIVMPEWVTNPTDDDKRAMEFYHQVIEDIEAGITAVFTSMATRVPFFGWGPWEMVAGLRSKGWQAPDPSDQWQSQFDDGRVGLRRLAFRHYSSFHRWGMDDATGRTMGMWQMDSPNPLVFIPIDRMLHLRYGDMDNPEGLATLEAMYRLERILYGLTFIQGVGYEHTAGHASIMYDRNYSGDNAAKIRAMARALLSAQEGNYIEQIKDQLTAEIIDTAFSAAGDLEQTIQNLRILQLAMYGMQFVSISTMSGSGSFAAMSDASEMAVMFYNNMMAGNASQWNDQVGKALFSYPQNQFPNMTTRPLLKMVPKKKRVSLTELGQFGQALQAIMPLGEDDHIAIRTESGILPTTLPEGAEEGTSKSTGTPGATVAGIQAIVTAVADGTMTPAIARKTLLFIGLDPASADEIVNEALGVGPEQELTTELQGPNERFSPVEDVLERDEVDQLKRIYQDAFTAQYQAVNVRSIIRDTGDLTAVTKEELAASVRDSGDVPTLDETLSDDATNELLAIMTLFAMLGNNEGKEQANRQLTAVEQFGVNREINDYLTQRLSSLLGENPDNAVFNGRIDSPFLQQSLDDTTYLAIASMLQRAYRLAQQERDVPTMKMVDEIYQSEINREVDRRSQLVAESEAAVAFSSALYFTVLATQPATKEWLRTRSLDPRQEHLDQVGVVVAFDAAFPTGEFWSQELINCKCGIRVGYG